MATQVLDPNYSVTFVNPDLKGRSLKLPLPESFSFSVQSTWAPFSEAGLIDMVNFAGETTQSWTSGIPVIGGIASGGAKVGTKIETLRIQAQNKNAYVASFARQFWQSTNPIDFQLKFDLVAFEDAAEEVMGKIEALGKLALPKKGNVSDIKVEGFNVGSTVSSVSSSLLGNQGNGEAILPPTRETSLYIGQRIYFPNIIIVNITPTFEVKPDRSGNYIMASVDVSIRTSFIPTSSDFVFSKNRSTQEEAEIAGRTT
jgi:hypothetical protein